MNLNKTMLNNDKKFKLNTYFTYVFAIVALTFFILPHKDGSLDNHRQMFGTFSIFFIQFQAFFFIVWITAASDLLLVICYLGFTILLDIALILSVMFFFKTILGKPLTVKKYLFFCVNQVIYSIILFVVGLYFLIEGLEINGEISNSPMIHYNSFAITALIALVIAVIQLVNFLYISKNIKKELLNN